MTEARDPCETVREITDNSLIGIINDEGSDDSPPRTGTNQKIEYSKIFATVRLSQISGHAIRLFEEPWEARIIVLKTKMSETGTGRMPRTRANRRGRRRKAGNSEDDWLKEI